MIVLSAREGNGVGSNDDPMLREVKSVRRACLI